jgi:uncharacterized membrane protein YqjE
MSVSSGGGGDVDLSRTPRQADKSLGELFSELTGDLGRLMRQEVALARTEVKEEVGRAGKAGAMLAVGGLIAYLALMFLSFALAWLLDDVMPRSLSFLIVAVVHLIVAGVLVMQGRKRMSQVSPVPQQTVETLKEDVEWAKAQRS